MAKKKRQNNGNLTLTAALIFIIILVLVWAFSSGNDLAIFRKSPSIKETISQNSNQETDPSKEVTENEDEAESPSEDNSGQQAVDESKKEAEAEPEDEAGQGSDEDSLFDESLDPSTLDSTTKSWSFKRNETHEPVIGYNEGIPLENYDAFYRVNTDEKVIYLTFDEGYENGFTPEILDVLAANDVTAAFFVTEYYIRSNPELTKRMKDEGHVVGSHSTTHPNFAELTHEQIIMELEEAEKTMLDTTGYPMDLFFRPPEGKFSEKSLFLTRLEGYKTIFWSMAYKDWDVNDQPGKEYAYEHVMTNDHPGAIPLLHAVSQSNTEALDDIIKSLKAEGYRFGSLYELN